MSRDEFAEPNLRSGALPRRSSWVRRRLSRSRPTRTTLLVGHSHGIAALYRQLLQHPRAGHHVIGCCLSTPGRADGPLPGLPVLGGRQDVVAVVRRYDVDTVAVLPTSGWDRAALRRLQSELAPTQADLVLASAATGLTGSPEPDDGGSPAPQERPIRRGVHGVTKASFDFVVAALILALLAPVLLGIAVCVKATSTGPVFVRLPRVGLDGRPFHLLRFRTTETGAESQGYRAVDRRHGGAAQAGRTPEPTPVGAVLRRHGLDELPQVLNVLKGDMSVVGPRPERPPSGTTHLGADEHRGPPVKPGLTGLVVSHAGGSRAGDSGMPVRDYVGSWSLLLDLAILRAAIGAALRGSPVR